MNNLIQTRRQHIIIYTTVQKFGVSKIFLKKLILLFGEDAKLIKSDSKYLYIVTKNIFQINAILLSFLTIKE